MPYDPRLTPRENEVVDMLVEGYDNLAISLHLGIQERTVKEHLHNIFGKYRVNSRLDLAVTVLKRRHRDEMEAVMDITKR